MKELQTTTRDVARELARKYSTMSHDELDILESVLVPKKYAKGEMILSEGDISQSIYYIEKGLVREFYYKNNKEVTEYLAVEGTIMMSIERALEPAIIYELPKKRLEEVALHNVNIQILYRKILEESLILSQVHADLVRFESAENRYRRMCKLSPQIALRAPLVFIASYLQMTPETLSRVRSTTLLD